jgi:predicted flap endonuclease-1-like 5' DNA nuclease
MSELWAVYWPVVLIAVAIGLITGIIIFRPKQTVLLSREEEPVRPHMRQPNITPQHDIPPEIVRTRPGRNEGLVDEVAAAAGDVVGQVIGAPVHANLPEGGETPDNLQKMKGVGPKLATMLNSKGLMTFAQIAALTPSDVERIDADLGAFRGRLVRDRIVEQAAFLARGDQAGYEASFGKL